MFIDKYKQSNTIKNCKNFFKKIEELKSYLIEFNKDDTIKEKNYLVNYTVNNSNY